jgi:hypothetical protein
MSNVRQNHNSVATSLVDEMVCSSQFLVKPINTMISMLLCSQVADFESFKNIIIKKFGNVEACLKKVSK